MIFLPSNFKRQQIFNESLLSCSHCTRKKQDSHDFCLHGVYNLVQKTGMKTIIKGN